MDQYIIEEVKEEHLEDILEIYNYYILNSTATFHRNTLTPDEMKAIVMFNNPRYRAFVIKEGKVICGYCILCPFKPREAYNRTAEVTVYLRRDYIGKGLGSMAMKHIEAFAATQDVHELLAIICGENKESIRLYERLGYEKCAHYKQVGEKFDRLLDVVCYQKSI